MTKEQDNLLNKKFFKKSWFWIIVAIILLFLLIAFIGSNSSTDNNNDNSSAIDPKQLDIVTGEQLVVAGVNAGIAGAALDGSGEIINFECLALSKIATRNGGDFFDKEVCKPGSSGFLAKSDKTSQTNVITLYQDSAYSGSVRYCAKFTFNKDKTELISYSFSDEVCKGFRLPVSETDVKDLDSLQQYISESRQ